MRRGGMSKGFDCRPQFLMPHGLLLKRNASGNRLPCLTKTRRASARPHRMTEYATSWDKTEIDGSHLLEDLA